MNNKLYSLFALIVMFGVSIVTARADLSGYAFSVVSGTYQEISGGTVLATGGADDVTYTGRSIGFTFTFNGQNYTTVSVNTNGFIWFGSSSFGSYVPNPISRSSTYTGSGVVSALGDDLKGDNSNGELRIQTIGSAPNRVCVIQWKNWRRYYQNNLYNFQIRLYETSNKIEIHYGSFTGTTSSWYSKEVGLRGATRTDFNNVRVNIGGSWSSPQQGTSYSDQCYLNNSQYPASGTIYRWQLPQNDAGITAITAPVSPFSPGTYQVKAELKNFGAATLTSVTIKWSVDGTQQGTVNWTGSLGTGQTAEVVLGNWTFASGSLYNFSVWTENPNNTTDDNPSNDQYNVVMASALCGTYTIGPAPSDFATIQEAVNLVASAGVSCNVTFNIKSGTYTEQITIPEIPGAGPNARVTFQSQTGNASDVVIQYNSTSSMNNWVIRFDGADYVTWKNTTIQPLSTYYARCVEFYNGANHNILDGNVFEGVGGSSSYYRAIVYSYASSTAQNNNNIIRNNTFNNGSYSIYWYGSWGTHGSGLQILNNTFTNYYYRSIYCYYVDDVTVSGNSAQTNSTYSFMYVHYFGYVNGFTYTKNTVAGSRGGYGLYLYRVSGTAANPALVANNFIQIGDPSYSYSAYGAYVYYCSHLNFYHNNINCASASSYGRALYFGAYGTNVNFVNNVIANTGNGYAIYGFGNGIGTMDYNDIYTASSSRYCYYNGNRNSLSAWQNATGWDTHSLDVDPGFTSTTDLHVSEPLLNGAGTYVGIDEDIDGNVRNTAAPDIGADEFTPTGLDATIVLMSPVKPAPPGNNTVTVKIVNIRTTPITSVRLQYSDGTTTVQQVFTGLNIPSEGSATLSFSTPYNLQGLVTLVVTILEVNGGADDVASNNTDQETLRPALIGHYSVGTSSSDFPTLGDALTALDQGGIVGNVWFDMASGTYTDVMELGPFVSSDPGYTVTLQSATGNPADVVFQPSSFSYPNYQIVLFRNASNWILNAITLRYTRGGAYRIIDFEGSNSNIVVQNCILDAGMTNTYWSTRVIEVYNAGLSNAVFANNEIIGGGYYSVYLYNFSGGISDVTFVNNIIRDFYYYGVYCGYVRDILFEANELHRANRSILSSFYGIYLNNCNDVQILRNRIHTVGPSASSYYTNALYISNGAQVNGTTLIANNLFYNLNTTGYLYTIYVYNSRASGTTKIYHNTLALTDPTATSAYSVGIRVTEWNAAGAMTDVQNNIVAITRSGTGYNMCVWYSPSGGALNSDHNVLYANGSSGFNFPGVYMWTAYGDLASYQAASGQDANSVAADPMLDNDYRIPWNSPAAKFTATPLSEVTTDINNDPRSMQFPDCGAFISPPSLYLVGDKDFGAIGRQTTKTLTLWNTSAKDPISVSNVQWGGDVGSFQTYLSGTTTPVPSTFTLPAGASQDVDVVFGIQGVSQPGQQTLLATFYNNAQQGAYTDQVTGYYASLTAVDPDNGNLDLLDPNNVLDMGQREAGETQPLIRTIMISADQLPLDEPIDISNVSFAGPDAALFRVTSTVPAALSGDVFVTIEMTVAGVAPGKKEAELHIQHSAANGPVSIIRIEGRIGSPILVAPTLVQTPPAAIGQTYASFDENSVGIPLTRGSVVDVEIYQVPTLSGAGAGMFEFVNNQGKYFVRGKYDVNGQVVPDGNLSDPSIWANPSANNPIVVSDVQPWLLYVRLKQPALNTQPGAYNAEFQLSDGSGTGVSNARRALTVTVVGEVLNDPTALPVYPTQLNFGTVPVGLTFSKNLILRNQSGVAGNAVLTVTGNDFHFAGGAKTVTVPMPASNSAVIVQVFFSPSAAGLQTGQLNITGVINEIVPLSGNGLAARADQIIFSVDGTQINAGGWVDFGQVPVGQIGTKTMVVENNSPAPITISQISRGGSNPTQFNVVASLPLLVPPHSSRSFTLQFIPTNTNPAVKEAQIVVYNTTGPFYFNVRGTAFYGTGAPVVYFTPSQYNFGNQSGQYTFTLHNDGNSAVTVSSVLTLGSSNFSIVNGPSNYTLAAGSTVDVVVAFDANSGTNGLRSGTLLAVIPGVSPYPTATLRGRVGPITVGDSAPESIEVTDGQLEIVAVTPQPAQGQNVTVQYLTSGLTMPVQAELHDLAGSVVLVVDAGNVEDGLHQLTLPIQSLSSGTYLLTLRSGSHSVSIPVIIQK